MATEQDKTLEDEFSDSVSKMSPNDQSGKEEGKYKINEFMMWTIDK